jgi:hypothetical protein
MPGVTVEIAPQPRVGRDGQEHEAAGPNERRRRPKQAGVVLHVLHDVEETDEIEPGAEGKAGSPGGDQAIGAPPPRQSEIAQARVEPHGKGPPGKLREDLSVPAAEVENEGGPLAAAPTKTFPHRRHDRAAPVLEPEVSVPEREEGPRTLVGEPRRSAAGAWHVG